VARRFTRSGRRSGPRRGTFWETTSTTALQTLTAGATEEVVNTLVLESELDSVPNPTLIRIRGHVFQRLGAASNLVEDCILLAHAIMIVDAKQLAIGVTAMPLPLSDNSEDFLWADSTFLSRGTTASVGEQMGIEQSDIVIDSKAMRKITLNQVVVMVTQMDVQSGTSGRDVDFGLQMRLLFKK